MEGGGRRGKGEGGEAGREGCREAGDGPGRIQQALREHDFQGLGSEFGRGTFAPLKFDNVRSAQPHPCWTKHNV